MVQGSLAHKLRVLRAERGLTLREAASLTGVAKETISDIERGLRHPHDPTLAKIAKGYGVPVGDLLEEPVPLAEASEETGRLEKERLEADSPKDRQHWETVLASVHERQSEVEAKVEELVELLRSEVNPYQVQWALDEAQDCEVALLLAQPGSRREQDKIMLEIDPLTVDVDQFEEWQQEWLIAKRFYDGIVESLVEAGLVELKERAGQKAEPVPVGIGA
jgi:transcriptional regulator with XRE-family HTH domain